MTPHVQTKICVIC